jgi:hypothetical protein
MTRFPAHVCLHVCGFMQLLVVSVTGTPAGPDGAGFTEDFVQAALLAKQAGA